MKKEQPYIVAYVMREIDQQGREILADHWAVYFSAKEANAAARKIYQDPNLYTLSIAKVVRSTDYTVLEP